MNDPTHPSEPTPEPSSFGSGLWSNIADSEPGTAIPASYHAPTFLRCFMLALVCIAIITPLARLMMWDGGTLNGPAYESPEVQKKMEIERRQARYQTKSGKMVIAISYGLVGAFVGFFAGMVTVSDALRGGAAGLTLGMVSGMVTMALGPDFPFFLAMLVELPIAAIIAMFYWAKFGTREG